MARILFLPCVGRDEWDPRKETGICVAGTDDEAFEVILFYMKIDIFLCVNKNGARRQGRKFGIQSGFSFQTEFNDGG